MGHGLGNRWCEIWEFQFAKKNCERSDCVQLLIGNGPYDKSKLTRACFISHTGQMMSFNCLDS